jgi:hypothetical protein
MTRSYDPSRPAPPQGGNHFQWLPALGAGFIAGAILLLVPRANPWSAMTVFSPVVMGRTLPPSVAVPLPISVLLHLGISLIYGLVISRVVTSLRLERAVPVGGGSGLVLYLLNFVVVSLFFPPLRYNEVSAAIAHLAFGLIAAGAYRGLLRRSTLIAQEV